MKPQRRRKQIRLEDYDYSQTGYYFVTICTKNRRKLFGEIVGVDDPVHPLKMHANELGEIINYCWESIDSVHEYIETDEFCLMPNHFHGIIKINDSDRQSRLPLPKIIQGFKSIITRMCFKFGYKNIWQRNYYEHIIRNQQELLEIREYILHNPMKWAEDKYYI